MPVTPLTRLRAMDPYAADAVVAIAAGAATRAGSTKYLSAALKKDVSRVRRYRAGTDPHSPFANALALHHQLDLGFSHDDLLRYE